MKISAPISSVLIWIVAMGAWLIDKFCLAINWVGKKAELFKSWIFC